MKQLVPGCHHLLISSLIVAIGVILSSRIPSAHADSTYKADFEHKNWKVNRLVREDSIIYRAMTSNENETAQVLLTIDVTDEDCKTPGMTFLEVVGATGDINQDDIKAKIRIDKGEVRNAIFYMQATSGLPILVIDAHSFDRVETLWNDLWNGNKLRVKWGPEKNPFYWRFSLSGSAAALLKMREMCELENNDEQYFLEENNMKEDAQYF